MSFPRIAALKTAEAFRSHVAALAIELPLADPLPAAGDLAMGRPFERRTGIVGNRFAILPMEGWDGETDGRPSELTRRRWRHFGISGAKLIWGGEAAAVRHDGRANPNQLLLNEQTLPDFDRLREELVAVHEDRFGRTDDLLVGLQLTHSGRFSRPNDKRRLEPRIVYRHPCLDRRFGIADDRPMLSDGDLASLADDFVRAARLAQRAGFAFVDVKHCHSYLGHELLSAVDRPGRYGGSLENRTRFLRDIVAGIRAEAPGLEVGVRVSMFDFRPFERGSGGTGIPMAVAEPYRYAFGADAATGLTVDLRETSELFTLFENLGIELVCTSAGSPYYNPHLLRPAAFPPSDGYQPPEDPLVGVARQIAATAWLKARHPRLALIGSGYSYLQEWLPQVAERAIRAGGADFIGIGRMVLAYPEFPADVLAGRPLARKRLCRTFSDCTTAPRNGLISGCFPLDPFYKNRPERIQLAAYKQA
ncbi:MAG TPA: NADH:flavin oxidoreductase [Pirellulales bacterium]|nr:NADH:flavin oxidoreductase [Pirellulales bacterium]